MIKPLSLRRRRLPGAVIYDLARLYFRFTLSLREVDERLAQRFVCAYGSIYNLVNTRPRLIGRPPLCAFPGRAVED